MKAIETCQLTKNFGLSKGVFDLNLCVEEGERFGFIGPNGAGKSTTIKLLLNMIYPTSGAAFIFGMDCAKESARIKQGVGYVPSDVRMYKNFKVKDLLDYAASFYQDIDRAYVEELVKLFEVDISRKFGQLSFGNKKKVSVIQALMHRPKLILLDEPSNGLDPIMQERLFDVLERLSQDGSTVFMSSHNLDEVQRFCQKVAIIREGKLVRTAETSEISLERPKTIRISAAADVLSALSKQYTGSTLQNGVLTFTYQGDIGVLLRQLAALELTDVTISDVKLADAFMSYYGGRGNEYV